MATKVIGPTGSRRRHWLFLLCLGVAAASAVVFIPGALANNVKLQTFELDGNIAQDGASATPTTYDWANFFNTSGAKSPVLPDASRPGYTSSSFVRDFNTTAGKKGSVVFDTADASTYTVGSKDILDVNGWSCTPANNVTDKGDIMNAYAAAYTAPGAGGHKFMFFALERNANAGDANVAFWFLQGSATCPAAGGSFVGNHHNGDLLIVSAFTNGGSVSSINAYEWQNGALNTTPVANGGDCSSTTLTADPTCATSNTAPISNIPWLTENKADGVGHTLQTSEFFEGGIDLSAPSVNLANNCFNTFVPDTRSSQSLTATLYDYALGQLGECKTTLSTNRGLSNPPNTGEVAPPANIGTGVVQSGTDTATLGITGTSTWSGALTWYLCGPFTTQAAASCPETLDANQQPIGNHGVQVGDPTSVSSSDSSNAYISSQANLTSAGWYCWHAHFAPDTDTANAGVSPGDDDGTNECFNVAAVTPTLTTSATCSHTPCVLGVDTLSDTAALSGTATEPGSGGPGGDTGLYKSIYLTNPTGLSGADTNISWTLYKVSCSGSTTTPSGSPIAANGDGSYGPVTYQPSLSDGVGDYTFVANYGGDGVNTNAAATATCASPHPGAGQTETITLTGSVTSSSTQRYLPNDRVTLTSTAGTVMTGTLTVTLYSGSPTINATTGVCTAGAGTSPINGQSYSFSVLTSTNSASFNTSNTDPATSPNTTFYIGTKPDGNAGGSAGNYFWLIHYNGSGLTNPPDRCESSSVSINDAP